jgi:type VI secretion system secreted protein Hcp
MIKSNQLIGLAVVASAVFFICSQTEGALNAYMSIKGQKQGMIQKGREGKIPVIAMKHEVSSAAESAVGVTRGSRISHGRFTVTTEWEMSTPALYNAFFTSEPLSEVLLEFYAPSAGAVGAPGLEMLHMTIRLTNATVAAISSQMLNNKNPELMRYREFAEISFAYQKIEIVHKPSNISAVGDVVTGRGLSALLLPEPKPLDLTEASPARLILP